MLELDNAMFLFDHEWREGDRSKAKEIAKIYVAQHQEELSEVFADYSLEQLVIEVGELRRTDRFADRIVVDMWLLSKFEPQRISGQAVITIPIPVAKSNIINLVQE